MKDFFYFDFNGEEGVHTEELKFTLDERKHAATITFDVDHEASLKQFKKE